jgi:predicted aspartyl protease
MLIAPVHVTFFALLSLITEQKGGGTMKICYTIGAAILLTSTLGPIRAEKLGPSARRVLLDTEGGAIELRVEHPKDTQTRDALRQQLQEQVRTGVASETPAMQQHGNEIQYRYENTPLGGKIHIIAKNREAVQAVREFLHLEMRSKKGSLGFEYVGSTGLVVIPVMVNNNGPYRFVLDTGASNTILSKSVADTLKIRKGESRSILTASGVVSVTLRNVNTLEVGAGRLENVQIAVGDFALLKTIKVDGILGSDYLRRFKVSIDYDEEIVDIEPCCPEISGLMA